MERRALSGVTAIRLLAPGDLRLAVASIDRSETVETAYRLRDGELEPRSVRWEVPRWDPEGDGPHSVSRIVAGLEPVLERGGILMGAFAGDDPAGVAVVEACFEPTMAWLAFLHVGRRFRRRGVASALWDRAAALAANAGAASMYVSATETGSAVGFYLSRGCELADPPHPGLLAMEPDDIHLVKQL